jgi:multidrug efflux pump subunit AcrB
LGKILARFNDWFDHQADRYGRVIAWALHHRRWMGTIALVSLITALGLQVKWGGTSFLPTADSGNLMIEVRTPASSSLEYARLKMERAAAIARTIAETKDTNSNITPSGGRIYVDIGKRTERKRSAKEIAVELRNKIKPLVGAEYTVLDDLNNGARKPVQIEFTGPDSASCWKLPAPIWKNCKVCPERSISACRSKIRKRAEDRTEPRPGKFYGYLIE